MTAKQVRVGIIGFGTQGSLYAGLIAAGRVPGAVLAAVADERDRSAAVAAVGGGIRYFDGDRAMLDSGLVDAVLVTVPHFFHPEVAIRALNAGVHVLVDKPAGVYTKQVREMNELAASKPELAFAMMFNQRTDPFYRRIKELIGTGELGAIRRSNWIITTWWRPQAYYDLDVWRATWGGEGGGVLANQAPHQLDLWQWICGVPKSVFAKAAYGFRRDIAVEDEVTALVDYGDGVTGVFVTATHDLVGTNRLEILCDQGKVVVENGTATIYRLALPERQLSEQVDAEQLRQLMVGEFPTASYVTVETLEQGPGIPGGQHAEVLANFVAHILDGTPLLAPGSEGIQGVRLANAIHLSSWLGREVPLDFDEEEYLALLNDRIREEGLFPERS